MLNGRIRNACAIGTIVVLVAATAIARIMVLIMEEAEDGDVPNNNNMVRVYMPCTSSSILSLENARSYEILLFFLFL